MSTLSNQDIQTAFYYGLIDIDPFEYKFVQPASYDLGIEGDVTLEPGKFTLLRTKERIRLGAEVAGQIHGKSSTGREGVMIHITAGFVDPGFDGTLTLECVNVSDKPVSYKDGTRICQIAFSYLKTPANPIYSGRYQNQVEATPSRR